MSILRSNTVFLITVIVLVGALQNPISIQQLNSPFGIQQKDGDAGGFPAKCPSCFNCQLPADKCYNSGICNTFNGKCQCQTGFGGDDCTAPLCGGLSDGLNRYPRPNDKKECQCKEGWGGINCNVCQTDNACDSFMPEKSNGTCYKGGIVVNESQQMCQVTNKGIVTVLPGRPEVTFSCNRTEETCNFQFWVGGDESFSCSLSKCEYENLELPPSAGEDFGQRCEEISCSCIPERYLCKSNSLSIDDTLKSIKGPGKFRCGPNKKCLFSGEACSNFNSPCLEPALDSIIQSLSGEKSITLDCEAGECMHYSQVPGYRQPPKPISGMIAGIASLSVGGFFAALLLVFFRFGPRRDSGLMPIKCDDESGKLMAHHTPATLSFRDIRYRVGDTDVLNGVLGVVEPGQIMAILGASGAGKTSLLDILARRDKTGMVSGDICINGRPLSIKDFNMLVGYVDQEDTLMPTLTVYETVLNSALLRLPSDMSFEAKHLRVEECLSELGILGIKDSRIGSSGKRGISGGEKRRVSIACELVTSPAILFLDEPTSGLDAFSAQVVVDCLVTLAKNFRRTIVLNIHQPRSDIFAKFDRLVLLSKGWSIFTGPASLASTHFESLGYPCPSGYNIADFLIDLAQEPPWTVDKFTDDASEATWIEHGNSQASIASEDSRVDPYLSSLIAGFKQSSVSTQLHEDISLLHESAQQARDSPRQTPSRPSWLAQFLILSRRTFINLYRNPILMFANYGISFFIAGLCSMVYYQVSDDIMGVQNRIGLFFFICALFAFSCLTSLQTFHPERILFMRERANGYYHPIVYFAAKVLFDLVPLRVVPPLLLGFVMYPLVGLNSGISHFGLFLASLVLFNLTVASFCLLLGIIIKDLSLSNLLASVMMLMSMILSGPFLQSKTAVIAWLQDISFFHSALEAMLSNEMSTLQVHDKKYGMVIDVPVAPILQVLGFNASQINYNLVKLSISLVTYLVLAYLALHFLVKEKR